MTNMEMARRLAAAVADCGGRAYYVGGFVRDRLLGIENKDIDIEVHGVSPETLERILDMLGTRLEMGRSFGVYGLKGYDLDIAMPRQEQATGRGHKDFQIAVDPDIGTEKAAMRRDFTINAMMEDVLTGEVVDPFQGREDLERGVIRHVNDGAFSEDALRVLRAAQFAARFGFTVAPETVAVCRGLDLSVLPRERVLEEMRKALLKAERPSVFFEVLRQMDQLGHWFPELKALIGVPQSMRFHQEGDVWIHTMMVLNQAASRCAQTREPFWFMLAALTHDFGKALCTEFFNGDYHAYDHENLGLPLAEAFLDRLTHEKRLTDYVLNMVRLHMKPNSLHQKASVKSTNKLFDASLVPEDLIHLSVCDNLGRILTEGTEGQEQFLWERLEVYHAYMARPYVMGKDLIALGLTPGPEFRELLDFAHKLRLAGVSKEDALRQTVGMRKTIRKQLGKSQGKA